MTCGSARLFRIGLLGLAIMGLAACGPGTAPAGQPLMMVVTDQTLGTVRQEFNRAAGETRVILLLSPT